MTREEKEQKAIAIVVNILQILESENLTVRDAKKILQAAIDNLSTVSMVSVPKTVEIECVKMPTFANYLLAPFQL
jgi:hypothetical protein